MKQKVFVNLLLILTFTLPLFVIDAYPECLNEESISDSCLSNLYENEEYEMFLKYEELSGIMDKKKKQLYKIVALYQSGRPIFLNPSSPDTAIWSALGSALPISSEANIIIRLRI